MFTEEEARKKWCPQARAASEDGAGVNRRDDGTMRLSCRCIASECMVWQWFGGVHQRRVFATGDDAQATVEPVRPDRVPASWVFFAFDPDEEVYSAGWLQPEAEAAVEREGYCGLAGKP